MEGIELVIKIPKEEYERIKNSSSYITWEEHLIAKGTVLPKGHGKLIDADYMRKELIYLMRTSKEGVTPEDIWAMSLFDIAPAVLEADKESEVE